MVNLIPPDGDRPVNRILTTDLICRSSQTSPTQTDGSPRLQAPAGAAVALRYQENGHVTLPQNQPGKPENRGTNYVYGTSESLPDDALLAIHRQWTADGSGGDGRGVLLSTLNFDDGQCFQGNNGLIGAQRVAEFQVDSLWCQQDILLPSDLEVGSLYTLYWSVVDYESGQDIHSAAVASQLANITNPSVVQDPETIAFTAVASGPASGQAASLSTSPTTTVDSFLSVHDVITSYATTFVTVTSTAVSAPRSTVTIYDIETVYVTMTVDDNSTPTTAIAPRAAPTLLKHHHNHHAFSLRARMPSF
ncbi:hypothetical protein DV735_g4781, partial [Chaetothyriales sp. CBS 134920]